MHWAKIRVREIFHRVKKKGFCSYEACCRSILMRFSCQLATCQHLDMGQKRKPVPFLFGGKPRFTAVQYAKQTIKRGRIFCKEADP